jgi:hypothetical protein
MYLKIRKKANNLLHFQLLSYPENCLKSSAFFANCSLIMGEGQKTEVLLSVKKLELICFALKRE